MRLLRVPQGIYMLDAQVQFTRCNHVQHIGGALLKFIMARNVMNQCGSRDKQRPFLRKLVEVKQRYRPAGGPEKSEIAAWTENVEILIEGGLANAVVNDVNSLPIGQALGLS